MQSVMLMMLLQGAGLAMAEIPLPVPFPERPALSAHVDQARIDSGEIQFDEFIEAGSKCFTARFNRLDGQGRPAATGDSKPTKRDSYVAPAFIRTSGPDANSCDGCHNQPRVGGSGDVVANVFTQAQFLDPVTESVSARLSNERNTPGLMGTGAIEMLAREMTADLIEIRESAMRLAHSSGTNATLPLMTKGVSFGSIKVRHDGTIDGSAIQGVDPDLVIKPFGRKGVAISLREFTINAMNHHHGMQAVERFGWPRTGQADFDEDSVPVELTVGDITACTIFQATLPVPGRVIPTDPSRQQAIERGERLFTRSGCASCHIPSLILNDRFFLEPNPYNRPGNLRPHHVLRPFRFDMTEDGPGPHLETTASGGAVVRAFTDLKRHRICDEEEPFFCNERLRQDGVRTDEFLTSRLWDVGSSAPYGHRGDLTMITEAILHHGGEARGSRDAFARLSTEEQAGIIEFLLSLQVVPEGAPRIVTKTQLGQVAR
ncbi:MAG: hypothetical protein HYY11_09555 [Candidatus Methylomirabilis oxyfera]|nr:hypothetical protein [Candidatus Methylomirabilis oxyfera]